MDAPYEVETYSDERISEFLEVDELTPERRREIHERLNHAL
jgi:hypothetical protein